MTNLILNIPFIGPVAKDCMAILFLCLMFVINQHAVNTDAEGAAKREEAIKDIDDVIEKPGGLDWPKYLNQSMQPTVIGLFIELWVAVGKRLGGLMPSSSGSKPTA